MQKRIRIRANPPVKPYSDLLAEVSRLDRGIVHQLVGIARLDDLAGLKHVSAVGDGKCHLRVLLDQKYRRAALVKFLDEKPQIKKIFLHFDNDNAGRKASLALKTILPSKYEVIDSPPPCGKDYNDFLCFQLGIHRNKTKERTNER